MSSTEMRQWRRRRAWDLKQQGWKQRDIAHALGVSEGAVSQWLKQARTRGAEALTAKPRRGTPSKLTQVQKEEVRRLLSIGAEANGFAGQVWTTSRVADLILHHLGVRYHPATMSDLLRELGWSQQKPIERASQRKEDAITDWKGIRWPALKKSRRRAVHHLVVDEASWYLLPMSVRTFAPVGQTPILRVKLTHDHLSAISAVSSAGDLYFALQAQSYDSTTVIQFLEQLLAEMVGNLLISWDGAPIHRSKAVQAFLAEGAAKRLHLEQLPGYAPDLNPDEGVWNWLKRVALKNQCFPNLSSLERAVLQAMDALRSRRDVLFGSIRQCGYVV